MKTNGKLSEYIKFNIAVASASLSAGSAAGAYFSMVGYKRALFIVNAGGLTAGERLTAQVMQAKGGSGDEAEALTDAVVAFDADAAEALAYVELDATTLGNDFTHIALNLTSAGNATVGATLVRQGGTGGQATPVQEAIAATVL